MAEINTTIWDGLYEAGNFLSYPSEVLVQLYFRTLGKGVQSGRFLDHGCGSGNNSEFLARQGWTVVGSDVSGKALGVQRSRLVSKDLKGEQLHLDSRRPLRDQVGVYDHVLCWDCLCYNHLPKAKEDAQALIGALATGGYIYINMPTLRHEFAMVGKRLADGSIVNNRLGTRQEGAIMAIPDSLDDLIGWFRGVDIVEGGHFTFDFAGFREFMFFVGHKRVV